MNGNEFAILTQSAFSEGFKEGENYILEKIKTDLEKASFEHYFEFGEYIGEDCRKMMIVKLDTVMQIIDKYIEELNNEM